MLIRALPVVDRLDRDGRTLLLLERRVIEVSPLALAAHLASVEGIELADLTRHLVDAFGAPPEGDPSDHVRRLVEQLATLGLVETS